MAAGPLTVCRLAPDAFDRQTEARARILHACVHDGASIGFVLPFSMEQARAFWRDRVRPAVAAEDSVLMIAQWGDQVAGTVQLSCPVLPNQAHRGEVSKLLVDPACRRRGVAKALMTRLEQEAAQRRRWLLTLDTRTGDTAEPLYAALGFARAGSIPDFAQDPYDPRKFDATTYMYKRLSRP